MTHYINKALADKYGVSAVTILYWITEAEQGKNGLQVEEVKNKLRIVDNEHNRAELEKLAKKAKKYRNKATSTKTIASPEFYTAFTPEERTDIINDLVTKKELNLKYSYKHAGAELWDDSYKKGVSPVKEAGLDLIMDVEDDLVNLLPDKPVNIVDLGPGNAYPAKSLLSIFDIAGNLNSYNAVDISSEMCELAENNVKKWFPDIITQIFQQDFEFARFGRIFATAKEFKQDSSNLILFFGNSINNITDRPALVRAIRDGMDSNDILVINCSVDTLSNRATVSYNRSNEVHYRQAIPLEMLGIDAKNCEYTIEFDPILNAKVKYLILDKDYQITIQDESIQTINLQKSDRILIWKHYLLTYHDIIDLFQLNRLQILNMRVHRSYDHAMVICKAV